MACVDLNWALRPLQREVYQSALEIECCTSILIQGESNTYGVKGNRQSTFKYIELELNRLNKWWYYS